MERSPLTATAATRHQGNGQSQDGTLFSRRLLAALLALRDGNFSLRLPADLTGVDGKIADTFNDIAAISERRSKETARVSRMVGKEGKLKQRMNVSGVSGGWADDITAVNML